MRYAREVGREVGRFGVLTGGVLTESTLSGNVGRHHATLKGAWVCVGVRWVQRIAQTQSCLISSVASFQYSLTQATVSKRYCIIMMRCRQASVMWFMLILSLSLSLSLSLCVCVRADPPRCATSDRLPAIGSVRGGGVGGGAATGARRPPLPPWCTCRRPSRPWSPPPRPTRIVRTVPADCVTAYGPLCAVPSLSEDRVDASANGRCPPRLRRPVSAESFDDHDGGRD
jgi:hypothetical protein